MESCFGVVQLTRFSGVLRSANRHPIFIQKKSPLAGGSLNSKIFSRLSTILKIFRSAVPLFPGTYNYRKGKERVSKQRVDIDTFFYPLDAIGHWNRIYGKNGFTQYQFILPKEASYKGLEEILTAISKSGKGSFLAVLKLYGKANDNWLSFPMEGYSLALDFKIERGLFELLDKLDEIVVKYEGRIYLTKDVRVSKKAFEKGYPQIDTFRQYRKENKLDRKFQSLQSKRVGI